jgi:hypothetical protein
MKRWCWWMLVAAGSIGATTVNAQATGLHLQIQPHKDSREGQFIAVDDVRLRTATEAELSAAYQAERASNSRTGSSLPSMMGAVCSRSSATRPCGFPKALDRQLPKDTVRCVETSRCCSGEVDTEERGAED